MALPFHDTQFFSELLDLRRGRSVGPGPVERRHDPRKPLRPRLRHEIAERPRIEHARQARGAAEIVHRDQQRGHRAAAEVGRIAGADIGLAAEGALRGVRQDIRVVLRARIGAGHREAGHDRVELGLVGRGDLVPDPRGLGGDGDRGGDMHLVLQGISALAARLPSAAGVVELTDHVGVRGRAPREGVHGADHRGVAGPGTVGADRGRIIAVFRIGAVYRRVEQRGADERYLRRRQRVERRDHEADLLGDRVGHLPGAVRLAVPEQHGVAGGPDRHAPSR